MPKRSSNPYLIGTLVLFLAVLLFRILPRYDVKLQGRTLIKADRWTGAVLVWNNKSLRWVELKNQRLIWDSK